LGSDENVARYERLKKREQKKAVYEEMVEEVPIIVAQLIEEVTAEECQLISAEQVKIASEYVSVNGGK